MNTDGTPQKPQGEGGTIATGFGYQQQPQQPQQQGYTPNAAPQQPQFYQQAPQQGQQHQQPQYYQGAPPQQQQYQPAYGATQQPPQGYQQQPQQGFQPQQGYQQPQQPQFSNPHQQPVYAGSARQPNECSQCRTAYPLPPGATSWRCRSCGHFQNNEPDCCTIL